MSYGRHLSEVAGCSRARTLGGHTESNPRPSEAGGGFLSPPLTTVASVCVGVCVYNYIHKCQCK